MQEATTKDYYDALKQWHPNVVANAEAVVRLGVGRDEFMQKFRASVGAVEVPPFVWEVVEHAYEYMVAVQASNAGRN